MAGVRMGERVLQIGFHDAMLTGVLVGKAGLSGHAVIVVKDDAQAARAQRACEDAGVLGEIHVGRFDVLPVEDTGFDVVVVHGNDAAFARADDEARIGTFRECRRVLRVGGRLLVIESEPRTGLVAALLSRGREVPDHARRDLASALSRAGFSAARVLAEREGHRFTEGLKGP
jgi:ubiquinone/menaquinone biosynthesis C-methylase UbiE